VTAPTNPAGPVDLSARAAAAFSRLYGLAYARVGPDLTIQQASPAFLALVDQPTALIGQPLSAVLWEFVGADEALRPVLAGQSPRYQLERVNRELPDGQIHYLTFWVVPWSETQPGAGLIVIVEDADRFGQLEQSLVQSRNELHLAQAQLLRANQKLEQLATTDDLTGLPNRRYFEQALRRELDRGQRYRHATALLLADVDQYSPFRDLYGNPLGDEVVKLVALLLADRLRGVDRLARLEAGSFALLLPETDLPGAAVVAERLRERVAREAGPALTAQRPGAADGAQFTLSLGVGAAPAQAATPSELWDVADAALTHAKATGRNRWSTTPTAYVISSK